MSYSLRPSADAQRAVADLLVREIPELAVSPAGRHMVVYEVPLDLRDLIVTTPLVQVSCWGGPETRFENRPNLDISVFGMDRDSSFEMCSRVSAVLLGYPWRVESGGRSVVLDFVSGSASPSRVPWADEHVWRYLSSFSLTIRR